ncbi:Transcription termination factor MTERF5, chloroplastic [Linum grandiflorum]
MRALVSNRCSSSSFGFTFLLSRPAFPTSRNRLFLPDKAFLFFQPKLANEGIVGVVRLSGPRSTPETLLTAEKEEAKALLALFLKEHGVSKSVASRTANKSDVFIDHLISKLHSLHRTRYLVGRELSTLEIRESLIPYLESLLEEHGNILVDVVESFPDLPDKETTSAASVATTTTTTTARPEITLSHEKLNAIAKVSEKGPTGDLPQHILYLIELGLDMERIKGITRKFPAFAHYTLEGKIRPVVEFLVDLGIPKSSIPLILSKRPQLCGISLSENLIPTMKLLESLGVDKGQWAKVIHRCPALLTYSRHKVEAVVKFLHEMGVSAENIGKLLTRYPNIMSYSVEDNLRPTAEYFSSLEVDVGLLLHRSPSTFGLSVEKNLKPITEFFLEKGYTKEDIRTMILRYGPLYTFSLEDNLMAKWDFFLTMEYSKDELVKFPQYFGYSLEKRIKPRYGLVREYGVKLLLNQVLSLSSAKFDTLLEKKLAKMKKESSPADMG